MELWHFTWSYLWYLLTSWFGLVALVLGLIDLAGFVSGRSWERVRAHRIPILLVLLFLGQFTAYRDLHMLNARDSTAAQKAAADIREQIAQLRGTLGERDKVLRTKEEQIEYRDRQILALQSASSRTPRPS